MMRDQRDVSERERFADAYGPQREFDGGPEYERGYARAPFERATERSRDYGQRDYPPREYGQREYGSRDLGLRESGGFGSQTYPPSWEGPFQGVGPKNYTRSDDRIREDVCDRLSMHGGVDARDIEVEVKQAEVILHGSVHDRRMKRMAEDAVDQVPGVRDVRNELRVSGTERGAITPGREEMRRDEPVTRGTTKAPMTSTRRTVFGVFDEADRAEDAVNELRDAGFDRNDISLLARSEKEARAAAGSSGAEAKGAGTGIVLGGIAGGALGWLVGAGALAIPGVGPVVALGALGTALAGAAAGAVAGGLIGLLAGLGVPEEQAKAYEAAIKRGAILVTCGCEDDREVQRARDILQRHSASDVRDYDAREAQRRLDEEKASGREREPVTASRE